MACAARDAAAVKALTAAKGEARTLLKAGAYPAAASALAAALAGFPGPASASAAAAAASDADASADVSSASPTLVALEPDVAGGAALVVRLMLSKALMMAGDLHAALRHTLWLQSAAARSPKALSKQASPPPRVHLPASVFASG